ncbi:MAG TPA: cytochrome c oxidase accessory protein CcoG [Noviherbaspirillum sp.]|nr:cytochrome c oxidase accessory protein CcoG [Noviherbaspirillum sp.]
MSNNGSASSTPVSLIPARSVKIYAREASGRYTNWRWAAVWLTQLVYFGLPWLSWNGRPAVLFDLAARKFYLFGLVLWPQDFIYLAGLLMLCAGLLFLLSALAGRVWCGFACPHTVYTGIFMWIEHRIEGNRSARIRLDKQPPSLAKALKKAGKHAAWILVALWIGITLVAYFTPMQTLLQEIAALSLGPWQLFWILCYGGLAYLNAGWMREQFCKHICAYARFQSVMFDRDTLLITYDPVRGEPRGVRRTWRRGAGPVLGDCIDCSVCVQVCPSGIDIRNGLQYECIDCAACVDACDAVMDKIGKPRGLIRYTSENGMRQGLSAQQLRLRLLRLRVLIYSGLLAAGLALYVGSLAMRVPLKLDVIADRGVMARITEDGSVENVYRLQVMNTDEKPHAYRIAISGVAGIALASEGLVEVAAASTQSVPVRVQAGEGTGQPGANPIRFELVAQDEPAIRVDAPASFFLPPHE